LTLPGNEFQPPGLGMTGPKPPWLRVQSALSPEVSRMKRLLRASDLHTVCEEASCPNIGECFRKGTATFMILGNICTRACPFCDVDHGKPLSPDPDEPKRLADTVGRMGLSFVVVTSVDRDDLPDGGAFQFRRVIQEVRSARPSTRIEILVPDFRNCEEKALDTLQNDPPDVFNHNIETVPRLYKTVRPGGDYERSLRLLSRYRNGNPGVPVKSGLMAGLGEEPGEVEAVMKDLRSAGCTVLTIGQYLPPSRNHLPVHRYATPDEFSRWEEAGRSLGFEHVASGPLVRSSYHAEEVERTLRPERTS
jgi:lipoic acid synthetase